MPVTLRDLVDDRTLGLTVTAGEHALVRAVAWVHVSELPDPTPFLEGGELLLTTGLGLGAETDFDAFVRRLAGSGVSGLGFGTGLSHDRVPAGLVRAARHAGLPLVEVPRRTPFIAISKAVSAALAADAYAEVTTTHAAQQALTKAALSRSGQAALVRKLAQLLEAWVLLVDGSGHPVQATPGSAVRRLGTVSAEVDRLRTRSGPASVAFSDDGDQISVQALRSRPAAFLAVGRPSALTRIDHHVLNSAVSLLTLALTRSQSLAAAQRRLRTGLMRLLLAGETDAAAESMADLWGPLPSPPVCVLAISGPRTARDRLADLLDAEPAQVAFFAELDDHVLALAGAEGDGVERLAGRVRQLTGLRAGVSDPVDYRAVVEGYRQAIQAVDTAQRIGAAAVRFAELGGRGLLSLVRSEDARAFAESLLSPLMRHDAAGRGDLVRSLREWLGQHGQWDPAATRLGVHRHTLRHRIAKVAELLGVNLDSPGVRAELWLATEVVSADQG